MAEPILVDSEIENENSGGTIVGGSNKCDLPPVSMSETGEGYPYAPMDFPKRGDNWIWKVGRRITKHGFMQDRFLFPPKRFKMYCKGKPYFASKKAIEEFVINEFPKTDLDDFWSSFHWKIPAKGCHSGTDLSHGTTSSRKHRKEEVPEEESDYEGNCKARNKRCHELQAKVHTLPAIDCDLCCSEHGFCRDCCCILCCKTIELSYEGYSFIRCEATVNKNYICGHVAHLDCALRSYMAGTIGGTIRLDVEYYCRRCDNRTSLIPHVNLLLNICQTIDSQEDIEKILSLGSRILRGSKQDEAKTLQDHIDLALGKLQNGNCLDEIQIDEEEDISGHSSVRERRRKETPTKRKRVEMEIKRIEKEGKQEEMEIKRVEKDIQKIIKRFPDDVLVAADDDDSSSCLNFETTPLNKRVIKTRDLVSVAITFDSVKKEKQKNREWFTVEESGNRTWISYAEVDGLIPRKWVTGNTIDWYGIKLRELMKRKTAGVHHQPFIICNNFFYTILAADYKKYMEKLEDEEVYKYLDFQNQTAVFAPKLNSNWTNQIPANNDVQSSILIPINYRNNHWALFVVHPIKRTIDLYDPLYKDHEVLKNYDEEMNALVTMLSMYYVHKDPTMSNTEWEKKVCCDLPKQPNHCDCGVLVIAYMDCICREVEIEFDEQKSSEYFRYILARDLLADGRKLTLQN